LPFLDRTETGDLSQPRLRAEWTKSKLKIEILRNNGKRGGRPRTIKNNDLDKPKASDLLNQTETTQFSKKESKKELHNQVDQAGQMQPLFSAHEIASAKLAYPLVRVEDELTRLIPWARDNWPDDPNVQARKVMASLANKQLALAAAPKNVADRDKPVVVSDALLNSRLVRKGGK
jgi:hypothetical protein